MQTDALDFRRLGIAGNEWTLRAEAAAVILAGGASRRMGQDKSLLPVGGRPMIEHIARQLRRHFAEVIVSVGDAAPYAFLQLPLVVDGAPERGPLMGIAAALAHSSRDLNFVTACDVPDVDLPLARRMLRAAAEGDYDAVVPRHGDGRMEPLHAVYQRRALRVVRDLLRAGEGRVGAVFARCRVKYIRLPAATELANLNTPADYAAYCAGSSAP